MIVSGDKRLNNLLTGTESGLAYVAIMRSLLRPTVRCLLIDNNADQSLRMATLLRGLGLECSPAESPNGAAKASSLEGLELVLLEASSSTIATLYLENLRAKIGSACVPKFICYSDAPAVADMSACILAGASDYLVQPFERELLRFKLLQAGIELDNRTLSD